MKGNGAGSRVDKFKATYPDEYSKVEHDKGLSRRMHRLFEDALDTCDPKADIAKCADQFFRANKLGGRRKRPSRNTVFGHLQLRDAFSKKLISAHNEMGDEDVTAWLNFLTTLPTAAKLEQVRAAVGPLAMKEYVLWAYRNPHNATDPFKVKGTTDGLLPCRLGLGEPTKKDYVGWGIGPDLGREVRAPTAFDPGFEHLARWEPGGRTKPDPGCGWHGAGLPEVVMRPPTFGHVAVDFKEIIAT